MNKATRAILVAILLLMVVGAGAFLGWGALSRSIVAEQQRAEQHRLMRAAEDEARREQELKEKRRVAALKIPLATVGGAKQAVLDDTNKPDPQGADTRKVTVVEMGAPPKGANEKIKTVPRFGLSSHATLGAELMKEDTAKPKQLPALAGLATLPVPPPILPPVTLAEIEKEVPPALEEQRVKAEQALTVEQDTVKILSDFECSTPLEIKKNSPTYFTVEVATKTELKNWFMFRVVGAKGKTVRIDIKNAPISKWRTLNPLWSRVPSANHPNILENIHYREPQPQLRGFNGPILPDTSEQTWHYLPNVWCESTASKHIGTFCMVRQFNSDAEYIAMRIPYTPSYNHLYLKELREHPDVRVLKIGSTAQKRDLTVVRIGRSNPATVPCILMYAREHGSEHDSSWVVQGAINHLLEDSEQSKALRKNFNWLVVPILDPDAAGKSSYEVITHQFVDDGGAGVEAQAYASFFKKWVDDGHRLDLAINIHNVESAEGPHMFSPAFEPDRTALCQAFHQLINARFSSNGYSISTQEPPAKTGWFRLAGYLGLMYGPLPMPYEVNSQEKNRHLTLKELRTMGAMFAEQSAEFLSGRSADDLNTSIVRSRAVRDVRVARFMSRMSDIGKPLTDALQIEWVSRSHALETSPDTSSPPPQQK